MPIDRLFTHDYFLSEDSVPAFYRQIGTNSIYFAKGNVFDYEYFGFDGLFVQYVPCTGLNWECNSLIRGGDLPEIPILIIGLGRTCMLWIDPNKEPGFKSITSKYSEMVRDFGGKEHLKRFVLENDTRHFAHLHYHPFAPTNEGVSALVLEVMSTLDRQGCKHIGFHGIYTRERESDERAAVHSVEIWLKNHLDSGMRVTMVDARDGYNKHLR